MSRIIIDYMGIKKYYDDVHRLHRIDGPAVIMPNGYKISYINGEKTGVLSQPDGVITFMYRSIYHREDGPAEQTPSGYKIWYKMDFFEWPTLT